MLNDTVWHYFGLRLHISCDHITLYFHQERHPQLILLISLVNSLAVTHRSSFRARCMGATQLWMLGLPLRVRASSIFQAAEQELEAVAALVAT